MLKIASLKIPKIEELEYKFFNVPEDMKDKIRVLDACTFASETGSEKDYILLDFSPLFNKEVKIWVEPKNLLFYGLDKVLSRFITYNDKDDNTKKIFNLISSNNDNSFYKTKNKLNKIRDDFQSGNSIKEQNIIQKSSAKIRLPVKFNGIVSEFSTIREYIKFYLNCMQQVLFEPDNLIAWSSSWKVDPNNIISKKQKGYLFLFKNVKSKMWDGYSYVNYINDIVNSFKSDNELTDIKDYIKMVLYTAFAESDDDGDDYKVKIENRKLQLANFYFKTFKRVTLIDFNFIESKTKNLYAKTHKYRNSLYFDMNGDYFIKLGDFVYLYDSDYTNERDLFNSTLPVENKKVILDKILNYYETFETDDYDNNDNVEIKEYINLILSFLKLNYGVIDTIDNYKYFKDEFTLDFIEQLTKKIDVKPIDLNLDKTIISHYSEFKEYNLPFTSLYLQERIKDFNTKQTSIANYLYVCKTEGGIIINNSFTNIITSCLKNKNKIKINNYILNGMPGIPQCIINYLSDNENFTRTLNEVEKYLNSNNKDEMLFYCYDRYGKFLMTSNEYSYVLSDFTDIVILVSNKEKKEYLIKFNEFDFII